MIRVAADQYLYDIKSYLPEDVTLTFYDPSDSLPDLRGTHALLLRTVNPITPQSLPKIPASLSFVGTGSSGTDHINQPYLEANNITFADAAGCNARSVAEYVTVGLLLWAERTTHSLEELTISIIGMGHVGTQVNQLLQKLGIKTICYDPPRDLRESSFHSASLKRVLSSNILTFHTPLTTAGKYPTRHWLDAETLSGSHFKLVINAARGGVIHEEALLNSYKSGSVSDFILDVWENEPQIHKRSAERAFLKTPHIAGYSVQAKRNASKFIADALLNHFDLKRERKPTQPDPIIIQEPIEQYGHFSQLMTHLHPIKSYQKRLKYIISQHWNDRGSRFNKLRASYPLRREFKNIRLPPAYFERFPVLDALGFRRIS